MRRIRTERVDQKQRSQHEETAQEDELRAVEITESSGEEEETGKGQGIGGDAA